MTPDPLLSLDPSLQQAVRSTVLTAKWKHGPADTYIGENRIHAYPIPRSGNLVAWGVIDPNWTCIATGVL